jgi:hypothetical protein
MTPTEQRARALVDLLARHDWPGAEAGFNAKMSAAVPADKLASIWTELESNAGPCAGVDEVKLETKDSLEGALVFGHFGPVRKRRSSLAWRMTYFLSSPPHLGLRATPIHRRATSGYRRATAVHRRATPIHRRAAPGYRRATAVHRRATPLLRRATPAHRRGTGARG